jgi:hypothetical protein
MTDRTIRPARLHRRGPRSRRLVLEQLEDRRLLTVGATVPWTRYEAEDGVLGNTAALLGPNRNIGDPAGEASGRMAVALSTTDDYVEWTVTAPANALVLRYSIPDAPRGGGIDSTIAIYHNGEYLQDLAVTSRYSWLYGGDDNDSKDPAAGPPRHIYDESHTLLSTPLAVGDTIRIQKDAADTAAFYDIDFIELENVAPLAQPANSISVVDEGAVPDASVDSTAAIQRTINDARAQGKEVWIPPGRFLQNSGLTASGVTIQGAGMWYSELWAAHSGDPSPGGDTALGFNVTGDNTKFYDFRITGAVTNRRSGGKAIRGVFGTGSELHDIWVEHTNNGVWVGIDNTTNPATNLLIDSCRFRDTFADGVNLCNGTVDSTIVNCTARNTGDDSFAIWSAPTAPRPDSGNVIQNCTAECIWKAAGVAVYGGANNTLADNLVVDTLTYPGITIEAGFGSFPFQGVTTVSGNALVRCGGVAYNQHHGALWVDVDDSNITATINVLDNLISDATYSAFEFNASSRGNSITGPLTFSDNTVEGADSLLLVSYYARGSAVFQNTSYSGLVQPMFVRNDSRGNFVVNSITAFDTAQDIGPVGQPGSDAFAADTGTWTLQGSGADIWDSADEFHYVSRSVQGDLTLIARVVSEDWTNDWAKAGVMLRESTAANSRFIDVVVTPGNGVALQWRSTPGGSSSNAQVTGVTAPEWVKLTRSGNSFAGFISDDGVTWTQTGSAQTINMASTVTAGLAVTSHDDTAVCTATFDNVTVLPATNLALHRSVVASSTAAGSPGNVVDGNPATSWTSASSDGQWISVDLGSVLSFDRVRLNWGSNWGVSYEIQVSNDASNWTTLYDTTAGTGGVEDLSGLAGQGRYVRLWLTQRNTTDSGYVLNEFSVYAV